MPRLDDAPELAEEVESAVLRPLMALHIDFPDPVYAFTGQGVIHFQGHDWIGIAGIAAIDAVTEATDGSAPGIIATLNEVPAVADDGSLNYDHLADQAVRGCQGELYIGAFDMDHQTVRGFVRVAKGKVQGYEISDAGATLSVKVTIESKAIDQRRPAIKRISDEYQQRKYPGDRVFEYAPRVAEIDIMWAKAPQDVTSNAGGGAGRSEFVQRA